MKKWVIPLICFMMMTTGGCQGKAGDGPSAPEEAKPAVKSWQVSFEHHNVNSRIPDKIAAAAERNKSGETASLLEDGGFWVLVTRGVKPTGGYSVRVTNILLEETGDRSKLVVFYKYQDPRPDQFVTQVLTTPMEIIRLTGVKKRPDEVVFKQE